MVSSARKVAAAIVAAAGRGDRMGVGVPKQYLHLAGVPVVVRAIRAVASAPSVGLVVVAVPPGDVERFEKDIVRGYSLSSACRCMVVEGGHDRQESVFSALSALESVLVSGELEGEADDYPIVVIHDGARPWPAPTGGERSTRPCATGLPRAACSHRHRQGGAEAPSCAPSTEPA